MDKALTYADEIGISFSKNFKFGWINGNLLNVITTVGELGVLGDGSTAEKELEGATIDGLNPYDGSDFTYDESSFFTNRAVLGNAYAGTAKEKKLEVFHSKLPFKWNASFQRRGEKLKNMYEGLVFKFGIEKAYRGNVISADVAFTNGSIAISSNIATATLTIDSAGRTILGTDSEAAQKTLIANAGVEFAYGDDDVENTQKCFKITAVTSYNTTSGVLVCRIEDDFNATQQTFGGKEIKVADKTTGIVRGLGTIATTASNIYDIAVDAGNAFGLDVPGRKIAVVSPATKKKLLTSKIFTDSGVSDVFYSTVRRGYIGTVSGIDFFVSENLPGGRKSNDWLVVAENIIQFKEVSVSPFMLKTEINNINVVGSFVRECAFQIRPFENRGVVVVKGA